MNERQLRYYLYLMDSLYGFSNSLKNNKLIGCLTVPPTVLGNLSLELEDF